MTSILEKAQSIKTKNLPSKREADLEMVEAAVAVANKEITYGQLAGALEVPLTTAQSRVIHALVSGVRTGKLVLKK